MAVTVSKIADQPAPDDPIETPSNIATSNKADEIPEIRVIRLTITGIMYLIQGHIEKLRLSQYQCPLPLLFLR